MTFFKRSITPLLIVTLSASAQDVVTLKNKDTFLGKVIELKDGIIELTSPHSESPLLIPNDNLKNIQLTNNGNTELPKNTQKVTLRNGDNFPGELITLDDTNLGFQTWFAGTLQIPRAQIASVQFGITPQNLLYAGPENIKNWQQPSHEPWRIRKNTLSSNSSGSISKNIPLTQNFIFTTNINWQRNNQFKINLCTTLDASSDDRVKDGYQVYISRNGINIFRLQTEESSSTRTQALISSQVKLGEFQYRDSKLEVRVNRDNNSVRLFLNGDELGYGIDPNTPPTGTSISIECSSSNSATLSSITVTDWDTVTSHQYLEARASEDTDTLTAQDGDRFTGEIQNYNPEQNTLTVLTPLSPEPMQIPIEHCSIMYFAEGSDLPKLNGAYRIDLQNESYLTLTSLQLGAKKLIAQHPLLEQINIDRTIISSIKNSK